jgi:acyl-CoA thioester hydrolase
MMSVRPAGRLGGECVGTVFEHPVSIRWRDMDALGHVNHAVFLTDLEEGRDACFQELLGDLNYVMVRLEIDMRAEIRLAHERVTVQVAVERMGTSSLTTRETIRTPDGQTAAEARVVNVRWDPGARTSVPFTGPERAKLTAAIG